MRWQLWQTSKANALPENVRNALVSQFRLDPQEIKQLRILKKSGKFAGRQVEFFQIFDPGMVKTDAPGRLSFEQLGDGGKFRSVLLYGGHIEKTGEIYVSDRRTKEPSAPAS